jgi:antitoxin Phd
MTSTWPLQDAKARFSELFSRVCTEGPQRVTRRGKEAIILISEEDYKSLSGQTPSLVDFLLSGPKADLDLGRPLEYGRPLDL